MRLDELIDRSDVYETTQTVVDRRVTIAARTALTGCAGSTVIYTRTWRNGDDGSLTGWIIDWFGNPTVGYTYTLLTLTVMIVLFAVTRGYTNANISQHRAVVAVSVAAVATVVPVVLAVVMWVTIIVIFIAMFALSIGFWVFVLWVFTQTN